MIYYLSSFTGQQIVHQLESITDFNPAKKFSSFKVSKEQDELLSD